MIGHKGETLKAVGTEARGDRGVFGRRVFLDLRVKVEKDWQRPGHTLWNVWDSAPKGWSRPRP